MPYISDWERRDLDGSLYALIGKLKEHARTVEPEDGRVNYVISKIMRELYTPNSYSRLNAGMGVLESAKQEFYRTVVVPYEDKKIIENGDI